MGMCASTQVSADPPLRVFVTVGFSHRLGAQETLTAICSMRTLRETWMKQPLGPGEDKQRLSLADPILEFNLGNSGTIQAVEVTVEVYDGSGTSIGRTTATMPATV